MITYDKAFDRLMKHEGGYVNHPDDPGGETKYGISKRSYPTVNIRDLTREQAKEIYRRDFWNPLAPHLHSAVLFQVFDASVNHGIGNAVRMLQRALGVADDGNFGRISQTAARAMNENDLLFRFLAERSIFMTKLRAFDTFGRGWIRRIGENLYHAAEDNAL